MINWMTQWWDKLLQSVVWNSVVSQMKTLDWILFFFVTMGIIYGIKKGFWKVVSDLLRVCIVIVLTLEFYGIPVQYLSTRLNLVSSEWMAMVAILLVAVVSWFLTSFIVRLGRKMLAAKTSPSVKVLGGMFLGSLYAFIFLGFLLQMVLLSPWDKPKQLIEADESFSGSYLVQVAPEIHRTVMRPIYFLKTKI